MSTASEIGGAPVSALTHACTTEVPGEERGGGVSRETIWRGDSEEPPKFEERHESMCPRSSTNSQEGKLFEGKRMGISICAEKALDKIQH